MNNMWLYTIHNILEILTCGLWQEYNVPCVDAVAYLQIYKGKYLCQIIDEDRSKIFSYEHLHKLYKDNLNAVALSTLRNDSATTIAKVAPK